MRWLPIDLGQLAPTTPPQCRLVSNVRSAGTTKGGEIYGHLNQWWASKYISGYPNKPICGMACIVCTPCRFCIGILQDPSVSLFLAAKCGAALILGHGRIVDGHFGVEIIGGNQKHSVHYTHYTLLVYHLRMCDPFATLWLGSFLPFFFMWF